MAALRRSLAFEPGAFTPVFPYVERFVASGTVAEHSHRRALYLVAGLFALHGKDAQVPFAARMAEMMRKRDSASIEKRFIALLGADSQSLPEHLRQAVAMLKADDLAFNYRSLLIDLSLLLNPYLEQERRERIFQQWAREFYGALGPASSSAEAPKQQ